MARCYTSIWDGIIRLRTDFGENLSHSTCWSLDSSPVVLLWWSIGYPLLGYALIASEIFYWLSDRETTHQLQNPKHVFKNPLFWNSCSLNVLFWSTSAVEAYVVVFVVVNINKNQSTQLSLGIPSTLNGVCQDKTVKDIKYKSLCLLLRTNVE